MPCEREDAMVNAPLQDDLLDKVCIILPQGNIFI